MGFHVLLRVTESPARKVLQDLSPKPSLELISIRPTLIVSDAYMSIPEMVSAADKDTIVFRWLPTFNEWRASGSKGSHKLPGRIFTADIQNVVAKYYGMSRKELISDSRKRRLSRPRQTAMYLAMKLTGRSMPEVGWWFGGRDHTTTLHAVRKTIVLRKEDPDFDLLLKYLEYICIQIHNTKTQRLEVMQDGAGI
jgi:hypothetical protein